MPLPFGYTFWQWGTSHGLIIYDGMARWPTSEALTCFPHGSRSSTMEYLMGLPPLVTHIPYFTIPVTPLGANHIYLVFTVACSAPTPPPPCWNMASQVCRLGSGCGCAAPGVCVSGFVLCFVACVPMGGNQV